MYPRSALAALLVLTSFSYQRVVESVVDAQKVVLHINTTAPVARIGDEFVCATLDWWPPEKCDYGYCSWGRASLLNLDLKDPRLINAVKGLSPLLVRLGGSLQDQIVYKVGDTTDPCTDFQKQSSGMFGFTGRCLNMSRWTELNSFFKQTEALVAFGRKNKVREQQLQGSMELVQNIYNLGPAAPITTGNFRFSTGCLNMSRWQQPSREQGNYAGGCRPKRSIRETNMFQGPWNSSNARELIGYTASKGQSVGVWFWHENGSGTESDQYSRLQPWTSQLGMAALHNKAVFCRQSINYGLLDSNFNPNPDFYSN